MAAEPKVLVIVLAGGEGKRLLPLTNDRAKPAVPFGGSYRLIDFALSNFANAGYLKIVVLTQYKSHSLDRHISQTWRFSTMLDNYVTPGAGPDAARSVLVPGLGRRDLPEPQPDPRREPRHRRACSAPTTSTGWTRARWSTHHRESGPVSRWRRSRCPKHEATEFGVIEVDDDGKILAFHEKVADPPTMPGDDQRCLACDGQLRVRHPDADRRRHAA